MSYMAERCGAWPVGDDPDAAALEFRLFFPAGVDPGIQSLEVTGTFAAPGAAPLQMTRDASDPRGEFWTATTPGPVPAGFYEYAYDVRFHNDSTRRVADPCARYSGLGELRSGVVVGGSSPAQNTVRPLAHKRLQLQDLIVYELMPDDFTAGYRGSRAPLDAVHDKLDHLAAVGINAILFMPWTAWRSRDFDWGYEPFQYFALEARYADAPDTPAEKLSRLKNLISACHDRGIQVIMDGVFNHVSREFPYPQLYQDPQTCPFTAATFGGSFTGLQDLDFAAECTNDLVLDVCTYWAGQFGLDGIRLDNTVNFYVPGDLRGLPRLLSSMQEWLQEREEQNFTFTVEHIDASAVTLTNATDTHSFWDNSLHELTFEWLWTGGFDERLLPALNNRRFLQDKRKAPTLYLSNHDHSHVNQRAGAKDEVGAPGSWWRVQPYLIALFTSTAVPLVHNGQEFGEEHYLPENDHDTGRRVTPRPLRWKIAGDRIGRSLTALHGALARIRTRHPALRSEFMYPRFWPEADTGPRPEGIGVDTNARTAVFHRWAGGALVENIVVVLNFADVDQVVTTPFPLDGTWVDLLAGEIDPDRPWSVEVSGFTAAVPTPSHWGRVLCRLHVP
ncbi:alpha-amylase family glycosyl hydrolase [Kineosporia sp. NBRC 101677]|uniref:alpha-amylase family glycosyl hydrolase n=1 Tax=Kineosporia sp. NBRC 101677 TaxID=3032197 RepID=UPI0025559A47|nr:alpha-amylase family glycosyl hydrolase [Kineosporia sp. NBRC 101677]